MILPTCAELSMSWCAAMASASGSVVWITGATGPAPQPPSSSGQTSDSSSDAMTAFSSTCSHDHSP